MAPPRSPVSAGATLRHLPRRRPNARPSRARAAFAGLAAAVAASLFGATPAHARADSAWHPLADRVFHEVAQTIDTPNALVPNAIAEGPDGFLWLGGDAGLLRWDGYAFRAYPAETGRPSGMSAVDVNVLFRDVAGHLWAGTYSGGLGRYDPREERLTNVPLTGGRCAGQHIWSLADDAAGGLFVGCRGGLVRLDPTGAQITDPARAPGQPATTPDIDVFALLRDRQGVLWAGTHHGVWRSTDNGHSFSAFSALAGPSMSVGMITEDVRGQLWVGTGQHGTYMISADRGRTQQIPATAPRSPGETAIYTNAVVEIAPGLIWIATDGNGIIEVDADTLRTSLIQRDPFVPNGLPSNSVSTIYRDRAGLIWVATNAGLLTYNAAAAGIMTVFGDPRRPASLPSDSVISLRTASDGTLWAGQQADGFTILDPKGRRATGLPGRRILAIAPAPPPAPAGDMLLGTDHGLYQADATGRVRGDLTVPGLTPGGSIDVLNTIGDTIWVSSLERGIWAMTLDAQGKLVTRARIAANSLTDSMPSAIAPAPGGLIAIGCDGGVNLYNPATAALERIMPDPKDPHGLPLGVVNAFHIDQQNRLWTATTNGLSILTGRDTAGHPQFRTLTAADGLPNAGVDSLIQDHAGHVWAATDRGLAVIDPRTLSVRALQRSDGLAITSYWVNSAASLPNGEVAFGGTGGITIVSPDAVIPWTYRPPVVVTAIRVGANALRMQPAADAVITVPPHANTLGVEFAALDYSAPAQNHYAYRLDGFDANWTEVDASHREANYTNLPPGAYRLHLRGSNRDGVWSEPDTTLQIDVLPAWYQTIWFRAVVLTAAIALGLAALQRWTDTLRKRQKELERQVALRTNQLSESQRQLQLSNAVLETRVAERTQALQDSEARFRAWFDHAEDAMFVVAVHPDGRFTYELLNAAVARIFSFDPATGCGRGPAELLPADYVPNELARYREATLGEPVHYETTYHGADGDRLIDTWLVPLRNATTGHVERLVGAARDLTERRALEARLAQSQKLQALGALAGGIAHDFNNILQAVAGAAMLMERRPEDQTKVVNLARSTIAAAERGTSITRRLLAFARNDALRVEALPTEDVLAGIAEVLKYTLGSAISVVTEFDPELPPILADRGQLETAIVNLGTNARDAMPAGGSLTLAACREDLELDPAHPAGLPAGAYVRIDVTDSGLGMDKGTLSRAMEPFFTTKPKGHGTGLGLPQVKGFAEQSGGQMVIFSRPGRGTTVSLWLRVAQADSLRPSSGKPSFTHRAPARETILVVDDDQLVRETLAEQLEYAGYTVPMAESGAHALRMLREGLRPDGMICDLSMPGMDGVQTIQSARAELPHLRCFLLTGYAGERAALDSAGDFTVLRKPITANALIAQIEESLSTVRV